MSTDPARARAFYTELIGWQVSEVDMGPNFGVYPMLMVGEYGFGGIVPFDASHGIPSHWMSYVGVADIDAYCASVTPAGGKVCVPPTPIPGVGRFAVVEDPTGGYFSPIQLDAPQPMPEGEPPQGLAWWHELMTTDPGRAAPFYEATLGWRAEPANMPTGEYWLFKRGDGTNAGGMWPIPAGAPIRPNWTVYVAVDDVAATHARALAMGATETFPVMAIPGVGRMGGFTDPTGASVALGRTER
jgi:hypothetical protein